MDNLAHTLVGAALGQAGLKHRTGLGMATLMIAANLPDLDALALLGGNIGWRRGWTHGPVGLLLLPVLLVPIMLWFDRWQARRGTRPAARLPVRAGWLLILAYAGILSHPLTDWLNVFGVRWLMPFSDRWFYGDTLFIADLWLWAALGLGIWLSRRREKHGPRIAGRPAIVALLVSAGYIALMSIGGRLAERQAEAAIVARGLPRPERILASPGPIDPFRRQIVFETDGAYGFGDFRWAPEPHLVLEPGRVRTNMSDPVIAEAAARDQGVADLLVWSRFPFAEIRRSGQGTEVIMGDARYHRHPGDGRFSVRARLPVSAASAALPPDSRRPNPRW